MKWTRKLQRIENHVTRTFMDSPSADGCIDFSRDEILDLAVRLGATREEAEAVARNLGQ